MWYAEFNLPELWSPAANRGNNRMQALEQSKTLIDRAYEVILDALCDGTFKPGERLTQEDIAARLNVSRQPITHALAVLKSQGFLISGRRGLIVTNVEPGFLQAIYQLRSAVEPLAVELATSRLDPASIAKGRALVERGKELVASGDAKACLEADMNFHSFIYELAGNPLIADTMRFHWIHMRRGMGQVLRFPGMSINVWKEHGEIFEAMVQGNKETAAALMRSHLLDAFERVKHEGSPEFLSPNPMKLVERNENTIGESFL
jgi:DNA-binding GntR family transcriptional regulator